MPRSLAKAAERRERPLHSLSVQPIGDKHKARDARGGRPIPQVFRRVHQVLDGMDGDGSGAALDLEYPFDTQEPVTVPMDQKAEPQSEGAPVERLVMREDKRADARGVIGRPYHCRGIPRLQPRLDLIQPGLAILPQDEIGVH